MFCNQCEQTAGGTGCTKYGVCGKSPEVAALQDLLIYNLKGLSQVTFEARKSKISLSKEDKFISEALFSTLTNVNFDGNKIIELIEKTVKYREKLKEKIKQTGKEINYPQGPAQFKPDNTKEKIIKQGQTEGIKLEPEINDQQSLKKILLFGLKGVAAYASHASILGEEDDEVFKFIQKGLTAITDNSLQTDKLLDLVLTCGKINLRAMELLDTAHTKTYGHPTPTQVPLGAKKGKAILVSGHDLKDLEEILKQTKDKGINIYTHGEMLPAHGYPELNKYQHLYGHYGTAWQNQQREFRDFPGSILMTTNCIRKPLEKYQNNIFTTGTVGFPEVTHITNKDFTSVIKKAQELTGFIHDEPKKNVTVGFARNAVISVADKIIEAVKTKKIRHFFLVGGCDGAKPGRDYYTQFVEKAPKDTIILTLACGKFRFFDKELGDINGIPRLIDIGQCNDAYSAIQIALALSNAFKLDVNELPLSMILSWYEQKAVAILLTLLHLGIKNIRLGPSLPAFITPNILQTLITNFNIKPITTPEKDLENILN